MAFIDMRTTVVETWIREVVEASPAIDTETVIGSVEAMLPHDAHYMAARGRRLAGLH